MDSYRAPLREMRFVLDEVLEIAFSLRGLGRSELTPDTVQAVLDEAARFSEQVIAPLNVGGDHEGAQHANGRVTTPSGFANAYREFCSAGWPTIGASSELGGQDLPACVEFAISEMLSSASLAWRTYSGLTAGAIALLKTHAAADQQVCYLPKLVTGEWLPTMCLTEPQCGTDLGLIRTRAMPAHDGSYRISGSKMFITGGEHDLTSNIVHLVLARLPDSPAGARGISLFLIPKFATESDAAAGRRNGITCSSIEHKMGVRGSATCVLAFDEAKGWLIGEPHGGLGCMFTMMNLARLEVGIQALGVAQLAHQQSISYAHSRRQGRSTRASASQSADPIVTHADVRRMLLTQSSLVEGSRVLAYYTAMQMDLSREHADAALRDSARARVALLTPVTKAFISAAAVECADLAVQIHGGHGYIKETGVEQLLRDARVLPIYEGTNGVQALDLLGRKVVADQGRAVFSLIAEIRQFSEQQQWDEQTAFVRKGLDEVLTEWEALSRELVSRASQNPEEIGAAASDYLQFAGLACLAWCWARMARVAAEGLARDDADSYYTRKLATARFFFLRMLPRTAMHAAACRAPVDSLTWQALVTEVT